MTISKIAVWITIGLFVIFVLPWLLVEGFCIISPSEKYDTSQTAQILEQARARFLAQQQAASSRENGWNKVAPLFTPGAKDAATCFHNGSKLFYYIYRGRENPLQTPIDFGKFITDFTPYYEQMAEALNAKVFVVPVPPDGQWVDPNAPTPDLLTLWRFVRSTMTMARHYLMTGEYQKALDAYLLCDKLGRALENESGSAVLQSQGMEYQSIALESYLTEISSFKESDALEKDTIQNFSAYQPRLQILFDMEDSAYFERESLFALMLSPYRAGRFDFFEFISGKGGTNFPFEERKVVDWYVGSIASPFILRDNALYGKYYLDLRKGFSGFTENGRSDASTYAGLISTQVAMAAGARKKFALLLLAFTPNFSGIYASFAYLQALSGAAQLTTAIEAYKADKKVYPESLQDLVPGYVSSLPPNPIPQDHAYRYKRIGNSFILYSPNLTGVDHGGNSRGNEPITNLTSSNADLVFYPYPTSNR